MFFLLKKVLSILISCLIILLSVNIYAREENITNKIAIGSSNDDQQIINILELFGDNTQSDYIKINGDIVNKYLKDGSNNETGVYSSVKVNTNDNIQGVTVKILTPENITNVSASAYENAAITAGAKNAEIEIAAVQTVTGEGALAGVYEIFNQAGVALEENDIQVAEQLIQIEKILNEETNMSQSDISKLVTEYNLSIIDALTNNEELNEETIEELLNTILVNYNFEFTDNVKNMLIGHGIAFSKSDVSHDPETRKALEQAMEKYEILKETYKSGDIEVEIKNIYFTDNRNEYAPENYDNVLTIEYILTNHGKDETGIGNDFTLYVNGKQADQYMSGEDLYGQVSENRSVDGKRSFGFNGSRENMELELKDNRVWNEQPLIIKLANDGTPVPGDHNSNNSDKNNSESTVSELSDELKSEIKNEQMIQILEGFIKANLNVMEPFIMKRQDFGAAPLLSKEAVQFGAQLSEFVFLDEFGEEVKYNSGRMFFVENKNDLETMKKYYDDLAKESAMFYSHTYAKGNILLQMGGDVPDEDFAKYVEVIDSIIK